MPDPYIHHSYVDPIPEAPTLPTHPPLQLVQVPFRPLCKGRTLHYYRHAGFPAILNPESDRLQPLPFGLMSSFFAFLGGFSFFVGCFVSIPFPGDDVQ